MKTFFVVMREEFQEPEDSYTAVVQAETTQQAGKLAKAEFKAALKKEKPNVGEIHVLVGFSGTAVIEGFGFETGVWE